MKRVSVVFTEHEESGVATIAELLAILERIAPEVIYLECPPAALDSYFTDSHGKLERMAVARYREGRSLELIPVDLPTPEASLFVKYHDLIDRISRTGPELDQLASWHRQYVEAHGFAYLNSPHCSDLFAKRHRAMLSAIAKVGDRDLAECYESWVRTNRLRESAMVTNIQNHCQTASFSGAAFLVGAAHRRSIIDLSTNGSEDASNNVQWDFSSFLVATGSRAAFRGDAA